MSLPCNRVKRLFVVDIGRCQANQFINGYDLKIIFDEWHGLIQIDAIYWPRDSRNLTCAQAPTSFFTLRWIDSVIVHLFWAAVSFMGDSTMEKRHSASYLWPDLERAFKKRCSVLKEVGWSNTNSSHHSKPSSSTGLFLSCLRVHSADLGDCWTSWLKADLSRLSLTRSSVFASSPGELCRLLHLWARGESLHHGRVDELDSSFDSDHFL